MSTQRKHLTLSERMDIQLGLKEGLKLIDIALKIDKSPRTVSYEIRTHLQKRENNRYQFTKAAKTTCKRHFKYPYTCDICQTKTSCLSPFFHYDAKNADKTYHMTLSTSRQGINLTPEEYSAVDTAVKQGVSRGQSPAHILSSHPELPLSTRTLYRHIENNLLSTQMYELRNKVTMRKRKLKKALVNDKGIFTGRCFMDYLSYCAKHPGIFTVQMDTVYGLKSDTKMILTFILIEFHFFYAIVISKGKDSVNQAINQLHNQLGDDDFKRIFPVILTDRGTEFGDPLSIEYDLRYMRRTTLFYCDPLASYQKGAIESIHRLLRYVFPKGKTIDFLKQDKLMDVVSAINSYKLRSNQFKTAYEMMAITFGHEVLDKLKVRAIDPDSIHLTPHLVK